MDGMGFVGGARELWGREEILYFVSDSISSIADQFWGKLVGHNLKPEVCLWCR